VWCCALPAASALKHLVNAPGQSWSGTGQVFKKAGGLDSTVRVVWAAGYSDWSCRITNDPAAHARAYAVRYWQEAGFRGLKSDGWQRHTSRIWLPDQANRLGWVRALAAAWMLTLGALAFADPDLKAHLTKGHVTTYALFRLGWRCCEALLDQTAPARLSLVPFIALPYPLAFPITVAQ
jgi:hypothetical protein